MASYQSGTGYRQGNEPNTSFQSGTSSYQSSGIYQSGTYQSSSYQPGTYQQSTTYQQGSSYQPSTYQGTSNLGSSLYKSGYQPPKPSDSKDGKWETFHHLWFYEIWFIFIMFHYLFKSLLYYLNLKIQENLYISQAF